MQIKNLKIRKRALALATVSLLKLTTLTGCNNNETDVVKVSSTVPDVTEAINSEDTKVNINIYDEDKLVKEITIGEKVISTSLLRLYSKEDDKFITNFDELIIDSDVKKDLSLVNVNYYNGEFNITIDNKIYPAESILFVVGEKAYSFSSLSLVNGKTKEDIREYSTLSYDAKASTSKEENTPLLAKEETQSDSEEILTDEEFDKLISNLAKELDERKIVYKKEDLADYLLLTNIDSLANTNTSKIKEIIGARKIDEVNVTAYMICGAKVTYNYSMWNSNKENAQENFFKISDVIFDKHEKEIVNEIQDRINKIGKITDDKEFNEAVISLFEDFYDVTKEYYTLSNGTLFALQEQLELVRGMYGMKYMPDDRFNKDGKNAILYLVPYNGDPEEYFDNNLLTGVSMNINGILKHCNNEVKTKTLEK